MSIYSSQDDKQTNDHEENIDDHTDYVLQYR